MAQRRTPKGIVAGIGSVLATLRRAGGSCLARSSWGGVLLAALLASADSEMHAARYGVAERDQSTLRARSMLPPLRSTSGDRLRALVRSYSAADDACRMPAPDELARRHGMRFRSSAQSASTDSAAHRSWERVAEMGVSVAFEHFAGTDRPWVGLVPEYHEHQESERFVGRLAAALAASVRASSARVFVEAWSRELELPSNRGPVGAHSGLEDMGVYPVSRACWDLMTLLRAEPSPAFGNIQRTARAALLDDRSMVRLLVGEHPTRRAAEQAVQLYARAWNAMAQGVPAIESAPVALPVGAGYYGNGGWNDVDRLVQLTVPTAADAYGRSSRLDLVAESLAATTSRIRTAQYAFFVLQRLTAHDERLGLVQVGANHMQPFIDLLKRAGVNVVLLLTPKAARWLSAEEDWRCPVSLLPVEPTPSLGYFRLPRSRAERARLRLWEVLPQPDRSVGR